MADVGVEIGSLVARAGAQVAYGEKVDVGGATLVPVALGAFAFGGGSGEGPEHEGAGGGGGGSSVSVPVGAYVGRDGTVRFVPNVVALLGVAIPLTLAAGFAAARVVRAARRG